MPGRRESRARWAVALALALAAPVGCDGEEKEPVDEGGKEGAEASSEPRTNEAAGEAMQSITLALLRDQLGRTYDVLHPGHQRLISHADFDECWSKFGEQFNIGDPVVEVVDVYDDPLDVEGIPQKRSKAVTLKVGDRNTVGEGPDVIPLLTDTSHTVYVNGRWTWIFRPAYVRSLRKGICPADEEPLKP